MLAMMEQDIGRRKVKAVSQLNNNQLCFAGRSGLAVACLTAVRGVLDRVALWAVVFIAKATVIYSLGHELCAPFLQCLGQLSLLPSVGR